MLLLLAVSGFWCAGTLSAQQYNGAEKPQREEAGGYLPQFFGTIKMKFETSTVNGDFRFNLRHTRFGVQGSVTKNIQYRMQVDFSNEGRLTFLDAYGIYKYGNFELSLGQQAYDFSTDMSRAPGANIFANYSFLAMYMTTYPEQTLAGTGVEGRVMALGARDLGAQARYTIMREGFPLTFSLGAFNGSGINAPVWSNSINIANRISAGRSDGFGFAASYYNGYTPKTTRVRFAGPLSGYTVDAMKYKLEMAGVELRYGKDNFRIEAEYAQQRLRYDGLKILSAAHVFGYYRFWLPNSQINYIAPTARFDMINNLCVSNTLTRGINTLDAQRITLGANLGFMRKFTGTELRFNYEKYFISDKPSDFHGNHQLHDKFTVEVIASF